EGGRRHGAGESEALQADVALVAPLLLVPVEVAVDELVVFGPVGGGAERGAHGSGALVAGLKATGRTAGEVGPGVVGLGVGDRLVVLVAEAALEHAVGGRAVGVVAVIAARDPRVVGVVGVDQLGAGPERDVAVVGAVDRAFGAGRAFRPGGFKAVFDARGGE